jgi:hypothetical protein
MPSSAMLFSPEVWRNRKPVPRAPALANCVLPPQSNTVSLSSEACWTCHVYRFVRRINWHEAQSEPPLRNPLPT